MESFKVSFKVSTLVLANSIEEANNKVDSMASDDFVWEHISTEVVDTDEDN